MALTPSRPGLCLAVLAVLCLIAAGCTPLGDSVGQPEAKSVPAASATVPIQIVTMPSSGTVNLTTDQCLTVDSLRGVKIDPQPPVLGKPAAPYAKNLADDTPPGQTPPYVAPGIEPFRFRFFNNEFNCGGWHTNDMVDSAAAHGFSMLDPYVRKPEEKTHLPAGTGWLCNGGGAEWEKNMTDHGVAKGRFDLLPDQNLMGWFTADPKFLKDSKPGDYAGLMLDMEHACLAP